MFTSIVPTNATKVAMSSNDILHNKHAMKEPLLEMSVMGTNFIKNCGYYVK